MQVEKQKQWQHFKQLSHDIIQMYNAEVVRTTKVQAQSKAWLYKVTFAIHYVTKKLIGPISFSLLKGRYNIGFVFKSIPWTVKVPLQFVLTFLDLAINNKYPFLEHCKTSDEIIFINSFNFIILYLQFKILMHCTSYFVCNWEQGSYS